MMENGLENSLPGGQQALRTLVDLAQYATLNGDETSPSAG